MLDEGIFQRVFQKNAFHVKRAAPLEYPAAPFGVVEFFGETHASASAGT